MREKVEDKEDKKGKLGKNNNDNNTNEEDRNEEIEGEATSSWKDAGPPLLSCFISRPFL